MIEEDVLCLRCTYNLRGLTSNGACPECGEPVQHSIDMSKVPDSLRSALLAMVATYWAMLLTPLMGLLALTDSGVSFSAAGLAIAILRLHVLRKLSSRLPRRVATLRLRFWILFIFVLLELIAAFAGTAFIAAAILGLMTPTYVPAIGWVLLVLLSIIPFGYLTTGIARAYNKLVTVRIIQIAGIFAIVGATALIVAPAFLNVGGLSIVGALLILVGLVACIAAPLLVLAASMDLA